MMQRACLDSREDGGRASRSRPLVLLALAWGLVVMGFLGLGCGDDDGGATPDTTPPAAVTDLAVASVTDSSATLAWTAPGDDGMTCTASQYDIRYSTNSGAAWDQMTQASREPTPKPSGQPESFVVTGLQPNTTYYFRMEVADEVPHWSGLSNLASAATRVSAGRGMRASFDGSAKYKGIAFQMSGTSSSLDFWFLKSATDSGILEIQLYSGTKASGDYKNGIGVLSDGNISVDRVGSYQPICSFAASTWYHISATVNTATTAGSVTVVVKDVNGGVVASATKDGRHAGSFDHMYLMLQAGSSSDFAYIDDIAITEGAVTRLSQNFDDGDIAGWNDGDANITVDSAAQRP